MGRWTGWAMGGQRERPVGFVTCVTPGPAPFVEKLYKQRLPAVWSGIQIID